MSQPVKCSCGAKKAHIIREHCQGEWTCYCNSCGLGSAEGYGDSHEAAIADYNHRQIKQNQEKT